MSMFETMTCLSAKIIERFGSPFVEMIDFFDFGNVMCKGITYLVTFSIVGAFELNLQGAGELKNSAFIDGDFIIGALFPVHSPPKDDIKPLKCGSIERTEGIELVEAAIFAIDSINNDTDFLPGIKLGINIKDDCENQRVAFYQTMQIIRNPKYKDEMPNSFLSTECLDDTPTQSPLIGMIGTVTKLNMLHYENLLKLYEIPQIGYSTSLSQLISPYFYLSVVPSDFHLAYLIIKILKKFNWNYITVAYTDEYFGKNGKYFLEEWMSTYNICISNSIHIPRTTQTVMFGQSVKHLFQNDKAKVIVCFCNEIALGEIFEEMKNYNLTGKYLILNSNEWPISKDLLSDYEYEAEGMLMIALRSKSVPGFKDHIKFLEDRINSSESQIHKRNPWLEDYREWKHSRNESTKLSSKNAKIAYVVESIYAFARGLQKMALDMCGPKKIQCLKNKPFNTTRYMNYLSNLTFFFNNETVEFSFHGSPNVGKFDIYNFQNVRNSFKFVKVGNYDCHHEDITDENSSKHLNFFGKIKFPKGEKIVSICSEQCPMGSAQVNDKELLCCWQCISCGESEYLVNKFTCAECPPGYLPYDNKTGCTAAPQKYLTLDDPRSLIALAISCSIITLALLTANIFIRNGDTPVIKSSCTPLYYIILCGVITLSSTNFMLIIKPNIVVCALAKTLPNVAISLIYIPVIFKTLQIFYLLKAMKNREPQFPWLITSLKFQVFIIIAIVILEMIILLSWILSHEYPLYKKTNQKDPETVIYLECKFQKKLWLDIANNIKHMIMIYYAIKIRKMSHNFHEAKFITIFTFVQASTNLAFRIVYDSSKFQIVSMFMGFSMDSFITLLLLFFPKLYIIIWRPEMNTDDNFKSFLALYHSYQ